MRRYGLPVDLTHDPEDEDALARLTAQFVERFEGTAGGKERGWVAEQLLQFKHGASTAT